MGTQYKLSDDQRNILDRIWDKRIAIENGCYDLDDLYADALEEWDMLDNHVDECIEALKEFGYLDKQDNVTIDGKQYLEVGYVPESIVNNVIINNIENQKNITTDKYVERNAPAVELGSVANFTGVSVENNESVVGGAIKEVVKGAMQGIANKKHK